MSSIRADEFGSPTEQVRAAVGWQARAEIYGGVAGGRPVVSRADCCAYCGAADLLRSRSGTWCNRHEFASRSTATCRDFALPDITITEA